MEFAKKLKENKSKTIIGMIHLDCLVGQKGFKEMNVVIEKAISDLKKLERGEVDAVLIENWKDETCGAFVDNEVIECLIEVISALKKESDISIGINVLPNDYRAAFRIAKECSLEFIQLDVFVDKVRTDYIYSNVQPFEIDVEIDDFKKVRDSFKAEEILVFAGIHPKHYKMLDKKSLEKSASEAVLNGADVIIVTGEITGDAPLFDTLIRVKKIIGEKPLFVGSGLNQQNCKELLSICDGAIVGTAFKDKNFEKVVLEKVKNLMEEVKII
jgi:hypothetical protein